MWRLIWEESCDYALIMAQIPIFLQVAGNGFSVMDKQPLNVPSGPIQRLARILFVLNIGISAPCSSQTGFMADVSWQHIYSCSPDFSGKYPYFD